MQPPPSVPGQAHPLRSCNFGPFLGTLFLGAFNDNLFKNALILLLVYQVAAEEDALASQLSNLAAGLFILPYLLFSTRAGQLADRFDKARLVRALKILELVLMLAAGWALINAQVGLLMGLLFAMATQSALFSPIKFSIIPQHLPGTQWAQANGWVEAATFVAILLGTLLAGVLFALPKGALWTALVLIALALAGLGCSRAIPPAPPRLSTTQRRALPWLSFWRLTLRFWRRRQLRMLILLNSWFWFLGASYLTQLPLYARSELGGNASLLSWLLACLTLGIGAGSLLCSHLRRDRLGRDLTLPALLGLAVSGWLLAAAPLAAPLPPTAGIGDLLSHDGGFRASLVLALLGTLAGLYIVPLCTQFQQYTGEHNRAQAFGVSNLFNALFMVASAVLGFVLLGVWQWPLGDFFHLLALANLGVFILLLGARPHWAGASWRLLRWRGRR